MADGQLDVRSSPASETEGELVDLECFRRRLLVFAARRLRNWSDAEDVVQEVLRRTLEALRTDRIRDLQALPSFLYQTATHVCQDHHRRIGKEGRALRRIGEVEPKVAADDPLASLIASQRIAEVRKGLDALKAEDRDLLLLSYAQSLRTADIARQLNLSEVNVRVKRHRALERLAAFIGARRSPNRG